MVDVFRRFQVAITLIDDPASRHGDDLDRRETRLNILDGRDPVRDRHDNVRDHEVHRDAFEGLDPLAAVMTS